MPKMPLNEISKEIVLHPLYFTEFCMEIDTVDDLAKVRKWRKVGMKKMKEMSIMMVRI